MNSNFFACEDVSEDKKIPMRTKLLFKSYSCEHALIFAKILGQLQSCSEKEHKHAEANLLRLFRIQDVACSEHEREFIRPKLIDSLERLTFEYLNILRYDIDAITKYSSFICSEEENVFNDSIFKWARGKISNKNLMYVESVLERNRRYFGVAEDGFPHKSYAHRNDFFENFLKNPMALMSTIVLIDTDAEFNSISEALVKELQKTGQSIKGVHIFKGKDILYKMSTGASVFYQKNRMLVF